MLQVLLVMPMEFYKKPKFNVLSNLEDINFIIYDGK